MNGPAEKQGHFFGLPKKVMHWAAGGPMNNNEGTSRTNQQRKPGNDDSDNKLHACRGAYWKARKVTEEQAPVNCWMDKLPNADGWWYEAAFA